MRQRWTVAEVKIRLMCGERRDLFIIPNTQAHLWNTVEVMSQLGFAWLLLGRLVDLHWWCNTWWQLQNELWSLRKHFVCQRKEKRIQTDQEILHHAARQQPKTHCQNNQGVHQGEKVEGFRLAKSISRLKLYWCYSFILSAKEESKGKNNNGKCLR